jgi:hypothetical protein
MKITEANQSVEMFVAMQGPRTIESTEIKGNRVFVTYRTTKGNVCEVVLDAFGNCERSQN